jgi:DNA-binding NarL/FixJ family response regulator
MIQVLIVEDHAAFRRFVRTTIENELGTVRITESSDGLNAVRQAHEIKPDLIVLDIGLPKLNGLEVAKKIIKDSPTAKILFLSQESSTEIVQEAFRIGAKGYVMKSDAGQELPAALGAVLRGDRFVSRSGGGIDFTTGLRMLV